MAFVTSLPVSAAAGVSFAKGSSAVTSQRTAARPVGRPSSSNRSTVMAAAGAGASDEVPDMAKRVTMNVLLGGTVGAVVVGAAVPFISFFVPTKSGGGSGGVSAKDALGNDILKEQYLKSHQAGSRELVQGLKGDATYLIVNDAGDDLEYYALNAVCTHLGCVVPWNRAENKFKCPCHGSQYSKTGAVVRGPAPLPLALERVEQDGAGKIVLKSWGKDEPDFRTNDTPWWNF
jgi:cytochrome b6-f complex iron-sulfur subunit